MIPRIFHWVWIGPKPLPEQYREWMKSWIRVHPDWAVKFWTNSNLPKLDNQWVFDECGCIAGMCDVLRLEVVLRYGGIYLDVDFECVRGMDHLLDRDLLLVREHPGILDTNIIGAVPDCPFVQHMVDTLPDIYEENRAPQRSISHATSLAVVNKCHATWRPTAPTLEDRRVFFPDQRGYEQTVGIHHYARSWFYQTPGVKMPTYADA